MKFAIVALASAAAVSAQVVNENGQFKCLGAAAGKNFCAGTSLQTNIIIRCTGEMGQPGNCNDNLAGVPPVGVKTFAPCWQTSETSGDAACSFNGIVYPDNGQPFPVPGASSSSSSTVAPTSSIPPYGYPTSTSASEPSTTETIPIYYPTSTIETTPIYYPTSTIETTPIYYPPSTIETTPIYYPTMPASNTTFITYVPSSTLVTVTGTVTKTSSITYATTYAPTVPVPPTNTTSYTTSRLPPPTQAPNGAGALLARDSLVLGAVALIGFLFL